MPARFAEVGDRHSAIDHVAHSLQPLLDMYERDEAEGRGDMPYPPDYPKMPGAEGGAALARSGSQTGLTTASGAASSLPA